MCCTCNPFMRWMLAESRIGFSSCNRAALSMRENCVYCATTFSVGTIHSTHARTHTIHIADDVNVSSVGQRIHPHYFQIFIKLNGLCNRITYVFCLSIALNITYLHSYRWLWGAVERMFSNISYMEVQRTYYYFIEYWHTEPNGSQRSKLYHHRIA